MFFIEGIKFHNSSGWEGKIRGRESRGKLHKSVYNIFTHMMPLYIYIYGMAKLSNEKSIIMGDGNFLVSPLNT